LNLSGARGRTGQRPTGSNWCSQAHLKVPTGAGCFARRTIRCGGRSTRSRFAR
jgi:hypothetical protein